MRLKQYLKEGLSWSEYMKIYKFDKKRAEKIKARLIKNLNLKRIKDPMTKYAKVGKTLDKFETPDGNYRLEMVGGYGVSGSFRSGKTRTVWRIWNNERGQYHEGQHKTIKKAQEALVTYLMRNDKVEIV
jgi:hypothetical protein